MSASRGERVRPRKFYRRASTFLSSTSPLEIETRRATDEELDMQAYPCFSSYLKFMREKGRERKQGSCMYHEYKA